MAIAVQIVEFGNDLLWFDVKDSEGAVHRYQTRRRPGATGCDALVWIQGQSPALTLASDGRPVLRRNGAGLPENINVSTTGDGCDPAALWIAEYAIVKDEAKVGSD